MKGTKQYYNKAALEWLHRRKDDDSVLPMFRKFFSYLQDNPRILDLCCGVGYDSERLNKMGASVVGVDFSEESIKIAKEEYPQNKFVVGNMLHDYSHLGMFDGCILLAGLVHIPNENLEISFSQLHKVMKEEAYVLIVVKEGFGKSERMSLKIVDGEKYDREFYDHTLEELIIASSDFFQFVVQHIDDSTSMWKNYIFKKS